MVQISFYTNTLNFILDLTYNKICYHKTNTLPSEMTILSTEMTILSAALP